MSASKCRRANESGCVASAGSSDSGASRIATCAVPPYWGRVSALPAIDASKMLLATTSRHAKRFIFSRFLVPDYNDRTIAFSFRPQRRHLAGQIEGSADRNRLAIRDFVKPHRVDIVS